MSVAQRAETRRVRPVSTRVAALGNEPRWPDWGVFVGASVAAAAVFWIVRGALIDDAYITLSYVRTLAEHGRWGIFPEETANSATSPLNVVVLAAVLRMLWAFGDLHAVDAAGVVFVLASGFATVFLVRAAARSGVPDAAGLRAGALVLLNPLVLSAVGLEMTLAAAGLSALLLASLNARPVSFGLATGFLVLTRIDLVVFAVVLLVGTPALWRASWRSVFAAATVMAPWFVFSWLALGSVVPDTLLIKQLQDYWGEWVFSNGLVLYLGEYPAATTLSLIGPLLALIAMPFFLTLAVSRRLPLPWTASGPAFLLGLGGLVHFAAYMLLGVPPYHWYYAPAIIGLSMSAALMLPAIGSAARATMTTIGGVLLAAQVVFVAIHGLPWREAPITTNGATFAEYQRMGHELGRIVGPATVSSPGEIGTLAYFCRCAIVDEFSDRGYLMAKIEQRHAELGPTGRWLLELNYLHLDRGLQPRPVDYELRRVDGWGPDPLWNGDSAYHEPAHFVLERSEAG